MPDIGSCKIAEEAFKIIFDLDLVLIFLPVFPLDEVLVQIVNKEGLNEGGIFFLLVVSRGFPRVDENRRR